MASSAKKEIIERGIRKNKTLLINSNYDLIEKIRSSEKNKNALENSSYDIIAKMETKIRI